MSEIESKVKAIIVDKLGVDEAEVKPEARSILLSFLCCHLDYIMYDSSGVLSAKIKSKSNFW